MGREETLTQKSENLFVVTHFGRVSSPKKFFFTEVRHVTKAGKQGGLYCGCLRGQHELNTEKQKWTRN